MVLEFLKFRMMIPGIERFFLARYLYLHLSYLIVASSTSNFARSGIFCGYFLLAHVEGGGSVRAA